MNGYLASRSSEVETREVENAALVRESAAECMVLLKNQGVLPLCIESAALFGNGARNTIKGGTGSGDVNSRSVTTVEQGFQNAGIRIVSEEWLNRQDENEARAKREYMEFIRSEAERTGSRSMIVTFDHPYRGTAPVPVTEADCKEADAAVYVVSRNSGEGGDRHDEKGDFQLYDEEIESLRMLSEHYRNVVLVLNTGGIVNLTEAEEMEGLSAILLMSQLGNVGGDVLLDVLTGKSVPSGKTTDTWAKSYADYPEAASFSHYGSVHDADYKEDIYVGYRYFDSFQVEPLYPFGYGLSYTEFSVSPAEVTLNGPEVSVTATVRNIGTEYAGKEVLQVYVSQPQTALDKPVKKLIAFAKTGLLQPGEEETVSIPFSLSDMASYCERSASWVLEAGDYSIRVGTSSADTEVYAVLTMPETKVVMKCKNVFAPDKELDIYRPDQERIQKDLARETSGAVRIQINPDAVSGSEIRYQESREEYPKYQGAPITLPEVMNGTHTLEELVSQLTLEELAEYCVGTLRVGGDSIVGNASNTVPGAAGDTSSICLTSRKIKGMIMADGPAGLRLQPHFKTDLEGKLLPGGDTLGGITVEFPAEYNESNSIDYYQYCTAIPIGWALAQSWNVQMVETLGKMIGSEMRKFGVDLWLAPALNIHRNPLCGRNFEYYSEDPLVSGKIAAAITNGVQSEKGKGTTIKHFAANNQEENRYFENNHVSERAMREIYLKGFEIAVRESAPLSIMSSYNLINGVHAATSHDLLQSMLRDEWGFDGFVMTDWFASQFIPSLQSKYKQEYPISASTGCVYAGNDVQMPGCRKNAEDLIQAVREDREIDGYRITRGDLQYCVTNILRTVIRTTEQ